MTGGGAGIHRLIPVLRTPQLDFRMVLPYAAGPFKSRRRALVRASEPVIPVPLPSSPHHHPPPHRLPHPRTPSVIPAKLVPDPDRGAGIHSDQRTPNPEPRVSKSPAVRSSSLERRATHARAQSGHCAPSGGRASRFVLAGGRASSVPCRLRRRAEAGTSPGSRILLILSPGGRPDPLPCGRASGRPRLEAGVPRSRATPAAESRPSPVTRTADPPSLNAASRGTRLRTS